MISVHFKNKIKQALYRPGKGVNVVSRGIAAVSELGKAMSGKEDGGKEGKDKE